MFDHNGYMAALPKEAVSPLAMHTQSLMQKEIGYPAFIYPQPNILVFKQLHLEILPFLIAFSFLNNFILVRVVTKVVVDPQSFLGTLFMNRKYTLDVMQPLYRQATYTQIHTLIHT